MPVVPALRKQGQNKDGSSLVYKGSNDSGTHSDHLAGGGGVQRSHMAILLGSQRSSTNSIEEIKGPLPCPHNRPLSQQRPPPTMN
jgi:hypothetical protein